MSRIIVLHEDEAREMIEAAVSRAVAAALDKIQQQASQPEPLEGYVTRQEAAKLLSCHHTTVARMEDRGDLAAYRLLGAIRYKKADVLNLSEK